MNNSLKKFLGDVHNGSKILASCGKCQKSKNLVTGGDLEQECLEKHEEALLVASYVEQPRMRGTRNLSSCRYNGQTSGTSMIRKEKNPVGSKWKTISCRSCGSYRHLAKECTDSWKNMSKINTNAEDEHMLLFTVYNLGDWQQDMDLESV